MKKSTRTAALYLILAIMGLAVAVYSLKAKNYVLLLVAALFSVVSTDNIFCNLNKR